MIYLSMPPLPGLPPNPKAEGNYLIVSKNLVELLACLVIATTPNGHWIGFDALLFGARRRRRLAARAGPAPAATIRIITNLERPLTAVHRNPPLGIDSIFLSEPFLVSNKEPPMTNLTPEQRVLGRENADRALGVSRRDLLKAAAAAPALGAFYFGYSDMAANRPSRPPSSAPATKAARR